MNAARSTINAPSPDAVPLHDLHGKWETADTVETFSNNLAAVRTRIIESCIRADRDPEGVRLLAVSKTMSEANIRLAYAAGCRFMGENKAQEALGKSEAMADLSDLKWSVIGHLQTNKAKFVARFAHEFQALDSLHLAEALDRRLQIEGRSLDVLIQVNTSSEASKSGFQPEDVAEFVRLMPQYSSLRVKGLMTLAMLSPEARQVRQCFVSLRNLRDRLQQDAPSGISLEELSMGMSGDFEIAIEEGATVVRVGQALFGARKMADQSTSPIPLTGEQS